MKFVSWNVNGIRACITKGFVDYFHAVDADFFCVQETKCQAGQVDLQLDGYEQYWNYAEKKGYSGTAIFTKHTPMSVRYGVGDDETEAEGRIITLEYADFFLVNVYTPNAQRDLARLPFRLAWEEKLAVYLKQLDAQKPVIYCGDLNVAHTDIDLKNAKSNKGNSGVTTEERAAMTNLLAAGFVDTFRALHPDAIDHYTWWSYMAKVRERNIGWRIDYFIASERIMPRVQHATIDAHMLGSDHCPIGLVIE
ncbi:exodeoxyribonuclease III [Caryophanon latum]|uniref:Exodeoxyribonuclease III n=1 Tax=Caryophanon latum TaxID=33977 RepID=A0A1C0Z4X2_9BACL|nr:exodeoxyribonuclease III [Caryophanon latum]OCS94431.1 exodeoxyribonuclease III [Caryophanon latum]